MQAGAGRLTHRPKTGQGAAAIGVHSDTAHMVMRRRADRDGLRVGVHAGGAAGGSDTREAGGKTAAKCRPCIEEHVVPLLHPGPDGPADDVARLRPVFEAMGDPERILHVGAAGTGYAVKLMINQLWFSHLVATAEVLAIGVKAGVDLAVLRNSLIASPANSNFVQNDVLSILDHGDYDEGFAIALACKDLGLSIDLARSVGAPSELSALVEQIYRRARAQYGDLAGEMSPVKLYEDLIGVDLRLETVVI